MVNYIDFSNIFRSKSKSSLLSSSKYFETIQKEVYSIDDILASIKGFAATPEETVLLVFFFRNFSDVSS
jgi:hypothetical protein